MERRARKGGRGASFPKFWLKVVGSTPLAGVTAHVLRHSPASVANDLGFTEATIAGPLGHAQGTVTGRYNHAVDSALITEADTVSGYIEALLSGCLFAHSSHLVDRNARREAIDVSSNMSGKEEEPALRESSASWMEGSQHRRFGSRSVEAALQLILAQSRH